MGVRNLNRVRKLCLSLPDATEKQAWGRPTFRVRVKMFVMYMDNHHDSGIDGIWCNAAVSGQDELVEADPENFFVPPYMGKSGWVGVRLDRGIDWGRVEEVVEEAWRVTAPKKLVASFDEE